MFLSKVKLAAVLGTALVAALTFSGRASADPGPGLRWSDMAWGSRGTQTRRAMPSYARSYYAYPRSYGYAPTYYPQASYYPQATPAVAWAVPVTPWSGSVASPSTTAAQETVAIRGPDGVVRSFPVQGGAVQQQVALPGQNVQSFVSVRGPDGVVRYYPVAASPSPAIPGQVIVNPGLPVYVMPPSR